MNVCRIKSDIWKWKLSQKRTLRHFFLNIFNESDQEISFSFTAPIELVTLLNSAGLYKTALQICTKFSIPYSSVFESLTRQCVILSEQESPNAWNWLIENDLQGEFYLHFYCCFLFSQYTVNIWKLTMAISKKPKKISRKI